MCPGFICLALGLIYKLELSVFTVIPSRLCSAPVSAAIKKKHIAATAVLDSCYGPFRFKSITLTLVLLVSVNKLVSSDHKRVLTVDIDSDVVAGSGSLQTSASFMILTIFLLSEGSWFFIFLNTSGVSE